MDTVAAGLIEIWPSRGRERVAIGLGAFERDGRYWLDGSRQDDNAAKLRKMFGSEAAKRMRDGAAIDAPSPSPFHPARRAQTQTPAPAEAAAAQDAPKLMDIIMGNEASWVWSENAAEIGATPGTVFMPTQAFVDRQGGFLRIVAETSGESAEFTIRGDAGDIQDSLEQAVSRFIRRQDPEQAIQAAQEQPIQEAAIQAAAEALSPGQALLDRLIAMSGGAKGPAVEWVGETLDRPQTAARAGMRAVVTSSSIAQGPLGSQAVKLVLDYRGFKAHNATRAGHESAPTSFETVDITVTPSEGEGLRAVAQKLGRTFRETELPSREIAPDHRSAAELRKDDERILMAEAANAEVVRAGEIPPAPIPPVNDSVVASRVYFWTAREEESPYCFKKLVSAAATANVALLVDRDKRSDHWGLRYVEATQAEIAALPDEMKAFLTEYARQAHLESKARARISKSIVADAAATAAVEVTTRTQEKVAAKDASQGKPAAKVSSKEASAKHAPVKDAPAKHAADDKPAAEPQAQQQSAPAPAQASEEKAPEATAPKKQETREQETLKLAVKKTEAQETEISEPERRNEQPEKARIVPLRPLAVPHPKHDHDGWLRARAALYNIETSKLVELMDLTWTKHRELELQEDMQATLGEDFPRAQARQLAAWSHGLKLGEKVLEKKGVAWINPERREQARNDETRSDQARSDQEPAGRGTPASYAADETLRAPEKQNTAQSPAKSDGDRASGRAPRGGAVQQLEG